MWRTGAHTGLTVDRRSSSEPAGAGAAVYDATGCHSATIAGNEPAPRPSEGPLTPLLAYEIAASRRYLTTTPDTMTTDIDEDGFRRTEAAYTPATD